MNASQIYIIDFYDSFTWNIASELSYLLNKKKINVPMSILSWNEISKDIFEREEKTIIIWGPGPGTHREYYSIFPMVKIAQNNKNIFNVGICLGHQILLVNLGHKLKRAKRPRHGESIQMSIPDQPLFKLEFRGKLIQVQLYNSWVIEDEVAESKIGYLHYEGEIMGAYGDQLLSYQFHPESIGTSCSEVFFLPIIDFLYNEI